MDQFRAKPAVHKQATPTSQPVSAPSAPRRNRGLIIKGLLIVVIIGVLVAGGVMAWRMKHGTTPLIGVNQDQYQALFLTNGQVYFGKLNSAGSQTIKISDIYYLQVQEKVQPAEGEQKEGDTSLVKLGEELHGPEDQMFIERHQVIFWENLKADGKVAQAIAEHQKK